MHILWFLMIGTLAGWLAAEIMHGDGFGMRGNMAIGIVGALIGGLLFSALNIGVYELLGSLIVATVGSVILLFLLNLAGRRSVL